MAGFFDFKEGGVPIIGMFVSFVVLVVGLVCTIYFEYIYEAPIYTPLRCTSCNFAQAYTSDEFKVMSDERTEEYKAENPEFAANMERMEAMREGGPGGPGGMPMPPMMDPMMGGMMGGPMWGQYPQWPLNCPECGEATLFRARQCKECKEIYFQQGMQRECPSCGFDPVAARSKD